MRFSSVLGRMFRRSIRFVVEVVVRNERKLIVGPEFLVNNKTGFRQRAYGSYNQYLSHQRQKLSKKFGLVKEYDLQYEGIVRERYSSLQFEWSGAAVLCLAARLGGEVRAFRSMGALALGVDIEPGDGSLYVLYGDFHNLQFADEVFDVVFCNAVDHVYDLERFLNEALRVLKVGGIFLVELCTTKPGEYESIDISSGKELVLEMLVSKFQLVEQYELQNAAGFVNWPGTGLVLRKR